MNENELDKAIAALDKGEFNDDSWSVIKKALAGSGEGWSAEKQKELLDKFRDFAYNSDEGKKALKAKLRETSTQRFTQRFKPFFNSILNGVDIATSLDQINSSNKAFKAIVQPTIAQSPGVPQELNNQLSLAQSQGGIEAQRALAPAQAENAEQYLSDINTAKQVSGGQGASFQSNAQSASFRRQRAAANYAQIQDAIKSRYQNMANQLATTKGQIQQQDFGNRLYGSQLALDQYNRQMAAAGALGQSGRLNLRNSLQNLGTNIPSLVGQILPNQTPQSTPIKTQPVVQAPVSQDYGKYTDYYNKIKNSLISTIPSLNSVDPSYIYSNRNLY